MSPEEIRELRGELSREEFAERVGVTPLTVYRWELETSARESRRPQRRIVKRLRDLRPGAVAPVAPVMEPISAPNLVDDSTSWPVFDLVLNGKWRDAERSVAELLNSSSSLDSVAGQVAHALLKLLWKNDVRSAWVMLSPVIRQVDELPASLAGRVHAVGALIFASPDGRIFSAGRVHAHVVRAERLLKADPDMRALVRVAEMWAAYHLGDAGLLERVRTQTEVDTGQAQASIVKWMVWEIGSISTYLSGCVVEAIQLLEELVEVSLKGDMPVLMVRGSAYLAGIQLFAARPVDEIRAALDQARIHAVEHRIEPGWPTFLLDTYEAECLSRDARFDECLLKLEHTRETALEFQWPPVELIYTWSRVLYLKGHLDNLRDIHQLLQGFEGGHRSTLARASLAFADGLLDFAEQRNRAAEKFAFAAELHRECGTLPQLEAYGFAMAFYAATISRDETKSPGYLRRAEQSLERVPLYWTTAVLRLFKSVEAAMDGRIDEALQHADAGETAFSRVGDQAQSLLGARLRTMNQFLLGEDKARGRIEASDKDWEALGLQVPPPYRLAAIEHLRDARYAHPRGPCATRDVVFAGAHLLSIYMNRLSVRGMSATQILEELFEVAIDLLEIPESTVRIDELTAKGPTTLFETGPEPRAFIEFGDGSGRRFSLGLSASIPRDQYTALNLLTHVASLAMEATTLRAMRNPARAAIQDDTTPAKIAGFVARAKSTKSLVQEIQRLSGSRASVLIYGESGVGKEVVAHAVYSSSARKSRSFVTFNCAAVPRELFEGQLFGYRKGAFTGATSHHPGVIRAADGGTLFLDEIGDLPLDLQPKLLRFLENGEVFPLGETHPIKVDVRVIAATHRDLEKMVKEGQFREDLYYRMAVVSLNIAPLRERPEDIAAIARHFIEQFVEDKPPALSEDAVAKLQAQKWPGNVRELRNVIERSLAYSPLPEVLTAADLRF